MKDFRNWVIIGLAIVVVYFAMSGRKEAIDQVKLDALENEKKDAIEKFYSLRTKTKKDSLNFIEHLRQDSVNSLNTERLEQSLTKARADYKEAVERNKVVFTYGQNQLDSIFRSLYPNPD